MSRPIRFRETHRAGSLFPLDYHHSPDYGWGSSAHHLWVLVVTWCADHLTDGEVTQQALRGFLSRVDDARQAETQLTIGGVLVVHRDGSATIPPDVYRIFNRTAEQVDELRAARALGGQMTGRKRATAGVRDGTGRFTSEKPPSMQEHGDDHA